MESNMDIKNFEQQINELYEKLTTTEMDYFELLGVPRTAITKDIEIAFKKQSAEFSADQLEKLRDPELKQKVKMIADRIKRAYEVLSDYDKRGRYEDRGYREAGPQDEKEEDPVEIAKILYKKAKTLYNRQDYNMAIAALEKAIHLDSGKPDNYYLLGVCQSRIPALIREAEKNLLKAVEMEPWNAEHYAALGMIFYSERLFSRAESYFRQALSKEPSHMLARKKLEEIAGPEKKPMDLLKDGLQKVFPTFFGKKKK
ncbi:MAG: DnaJ domain-containing protein [Candidatus Aminicenantes bacterium]|nr:DnaJ domain-containing protein [Candidatus Aminicenantes bacterium]